MSSENNDYGTPFLQSLFLMKLVLDRLGEKVSEVVSKNPGLSPVRDIFPLLAGNAKAKLNEVGIAFNNSDVETKIILDSITDQTGLIFLAQTYLGITPEINFPAPKETVTGGEILEAAGSVFERMGVIVEHPALVRSIRIAGTVMTIAGQTAKYQVGTKAAEKDIEEKLEQFKKVETKLDRLAETMNKGLTVSNLEIEAGRPGGPEREKPPGVRDENAGAGLAIDVAHVEPRGKRYIHLYPVKFMCGVMNGGDGLLKSRNHATSINIINILNQTVKFTIRASLTIPQTENQVSDIEITDSLKPHQSIEMDCAHIRRILGVPEEDFIKGFLIIESPRTAGLPQALEVVAVYSVLA
ncbi:MAG: hypothetical protein ACOY4I_03220 [Bacillota bacterium]